MVASASSPAALREPEAGTDHVRRRWGCRDALGPLVKLQVMDDSSALGSTGSHVAISSGSVKV